MVTSNTFVIEMTATVTTTFGVHIDADEAAEWLAANPGGDLIELAREKADDRAENDVDESDVDLSGVTWQVLDVQRERRYA